MVVQQVLVDSRIDGNHSSKNFVQVPLSIKMGMKVMRCVTKLRQKLNIPDFAVHIVLLSHIAEQVSAKFFSAFDDKQVCFHQLNCNKMKKRPYRCLSVKMFKHFCYMNSISIVLLIVFLLTTLCV